MNKSKDEIIQDFRSLGCEEPERWTESEFSDDECAQLAAYRFLRPLQSSLDIYSQQYQTWIQNIESSNHQNKLSRILKKMIEAGIKPKEIGYFAYQIASQAYNEVLNRIEDPTGGDFDLNHQGKVLPSWVLMELKDEEEREFTGRIIAGLNEQFPLRHME
ncbi:hypothetical protein QFZ81_003958 [Paenibacillus sp. V4I9]|uniref:hypothetical protein n=1 Tax=Paenibacillus sp. V4I9 TaxID=3042308 RepID=UPI002789D1F8|nr:hypothetical protein [Paenibacillus sp. V4I9]MDQ0888870.1 hypothetical protein [Paenibacillus sp. V4I9]